MDIRRVTNEFSVSPQIAPGNLAELEARGFAMVVCNRPDGEDPGQPTGAKIAESAAAAGMVFRHIAVAGSFPDSHIDDMADAIADAGGPVLAYCRSGTRSTLLWALAQASRGHDPDTIASDAAAAGYDIAPVRAAVDRLATRA